MYKYIEHNIFCYNITYISPTSAEPYISTTFTPRIELLLTIISIFCVIGENYLDRKVNKVWFQKRIGADRLSISKLEKLKKRPEKTGVAGAGNEFISNFRQHSLVPPMLITSGRELEITD